MNNKKFSNYFFIFLFLINTIEVFSMNRERSNSFHRRVKSFPASRGCVNNEDAIPLITSEGSSRSLRSGSFPSRPRDTIIAINDDSSPGFANTESPIIRIDNTKNRLKLFGEWLNKNKVPLFVGASMATIITYAYFTIIGGCGDLEAGGDQIRSGCNRMEDACLKMESSCNTCNNKMHGIANLADIVVSNCTNACTICADLYKFVTKKP